MCQWRTAPPWPEIYVTDSERRHGLNVIVMEQWMPTRRWGSAQGVPDDAGVACPRFLLRVNDRYDDAVDAKLMAWHRANELAAVDASANPNQYLSASLPTER